MANDWLHLPRTGEYFGGHAIELAGIIVDPRDQKHGLGLALVQQFIGQHRPDSLLAYTRNPAVLRIAGQVGDVSDVLTHDDPESVAELFPEPTIHDGVIYHVDRYAPGGLYGDFDPAERLYNGQVLKQRAVLLQNPNHALAVAVNLKGEES